MQAKISSSRIPPMNPPVSRYSLLIFPSYCKFIPQYSIARRFLKKHFILKSILAAPWTCICTGEHCIVYPSLILRVLCWNLYPENMKILTVTGSSAQLESLGVCRRPDAAFWMCNRSFSIYTTHSLANIDKPQTADNLHATHYRTCTHAIAWQRQLMYLLVSLREGFSVTRLVL